MIQLSYLLSFSFIDTHLYSSVESPILFKVNEVIIIIIFMIIFRNLALSGALLLVLAESSAEVKTMFAGIPHMGHNQKQSYMQLVGRILIVFMFLTLLNFQFSVMRFLMTICGLSLTVTVFLGYKTKLSALVLVILLSIINITYNAFWMVDFNRVIRDFLKYDFFQTLSVIGGLLYIVALGPGGVSLDEHKRE